MEKIIHKYILKDGNIYYLCNQSIKANWLKTDLANKRVSCKNCLKKIKSDRMKDYIKINNETYVKNSQIDKLKKVDLLDDFLFAYNEIEQYDTTDYLSGATNEKIESKCHTYFITYEIKKDIKFINYIDIDEYM